MAVSRRVSVSVAGIAATALALAVSGCSSSGGSTDGGSSGSSGGSYNWGVNAELSGAVSYYGISIRNGIEAYVDQVNAQGGINGHKINLTTLDSASNQARAAANATQLATATHVSAMFGSSLSADCTAGATVAERYKIASACLSIQTANPWVFSMGADNSKAAQTLVAAAQKVTGKTSVKAAVVIINTLTDEALAKAMPAALTGSGGSLATSQEIPITATDVSSQVAKIVASKPDAVLISETGPGLLSVLKGVRAAGLNTPFIWVDGTGNITALATSTDKNVYALSINQFVQPTATATAAKGYITAITPKLSGKIDSTALNGGEAIPAYMTASAFGAALKTCGYPCSGADLKTALEKTSVSFAGLVDNFQYTSTSHYPYPNWYLYHVVGTTTTLVDTLKASGTS